jgi:hypothetical protein
MATLPEFKPDPVQITPTLNRLNALDSVKGREEFLEVIYNNIVGEIISKDEPEQLYSLAVNYFLKLITESELYIDERDVIELEKCAILFVKCRKDPELSQIIPRINLPFLYVVSKRILNKYYQW